MFVSNSIFTSVIYISTLSHDSHVVLSRVIITFQLIIWQIWTRKSFILMILTTSCVCRGITYIMTPCTFHLFTIPTYLYLPEKHVQSYLVSDCFGNCFTVLHVWIKILILRKTEDTGKFDFGFLYSSSEIVFGRFSM